jgi:hypothetical protein
MLPNFSYSLASVQLGLSDKVRVRNTVRQAAIATFIRWTGEIDLPVIVGRPGCSVARFMEAVSTKTNLGAEMTDPAFLFMLPE